MKQKNTIFSSLSNKKSKAVITALLFAVLCCILNTIIHAEDLTDTLTYVKIYRYVDNTYTWVNADFTIDNNGNISTEYDYRAFQREMLDFKFSAKNVESITVQFTLIVSADASTPTVTQTAGSLRLRFDGTNVQTKTIRGGYRIQGNNVIYEVSSTRFDFETPVLIDEVDITTYIQSVSSEVSYTGVNLTINDETYEIKQQVDDIKDDITTIVDDIQSDINDVDSGIDSIYDGIVDPTNDTNVIGYIGELGHSFTAFLSLPMFEVFTIVPVLMVVSFIIFGGSKKE